MEERETPLVRQLAVGTYTEIVEIVAPSSAVAGSTVDVVVKIKNISVDKLRIYCGAVLDSETRFIDWLNAWVVFGETRSFSGSFVMPNKNVVINAYSYYEDLYGYLHWDDSKAKNVTLAAVPEPQFSGFGITDYFKI